MYITRQNLGNEKLEKAETRKRAAKKIILQKSSLKVEPWTRSIDWAAILPLS